MAVETPVKKKGMGTLTKTKYYELESKLKQEIPNEQQFNNVITIIKDITEFDPTISTYCPERKEQFAKYRRKKAEEMGVSTYKAFNLDKFYQKKKETRLLNKPS